MYIENNSLNKKKIITGDILDDKDELTGAIIDCLNALDLDAEVRAHVQDIILSKILSGTSLKVFPVLLSVSKILHYSICNVYLFFLVLDDRL